MTYMTDRSQGPTGALEGRYGATVAAGLNQRSAALPHDISERLRAGRERALFASRQARVPVAAHAHVVTGATSQGTAVLGQGQGLWIQLASWLPLALLVAGLVVIQQWNDQEKVLAAAEIDAVLLADDLPPSAWSDPGFREFLRAPRP